MKRHAFTMVELILVIVIFGIIGVIGADIIATMYKNYIYARTVNHLQSQSDITLQQIAKRLQYRVKNNGAVVAQKGATNNILTLAHQDVDESYDVIQWIGYSNEAMLNAGANPGWSGFIDLDNTTHTNSTTRHISTPGSSLGFANSVIDVLSYNDVKLNVANGGAALIFKGIPDTVTGVIEGYNWENTGIAADINYVVPVSRVSDNVLQIDTGDIPNVIYEQYYLAHTAYAIVAEEIDTSVYELKLYYNFQPWLGETYLSGGTISALLADNVNLFRVRQIGSTIRLKLCLHDNQASGAGDYIVTCKEEVVL
jgi:prepilin-type N-terminal cleavage/methylation domain-containing protein